MKIDYNKIFDDLVRYESIVVECSPEHRDALYSGIFSNKQYHQGVCRGSISCKHTAEGMLLTLKLPSGELL